MINLFKHENRVVHGMFSIISVILNMQCWNGQNLNERKIAQHGIAQDIMQHDNE